MRNPLIGALAAGVVVILAASPAAADLAAARNAYATLLSRYVTSRGVRYESWRSSGSDLKSISEVLMPFRSTDPATLQPNERKALYINIYNAKILEIVVLYNPKGSIKDLSRGTSGLEVFSRQVLDLDGKVISLNGLEKRLREEFKDPRTHFALNRASKSSPPLRPEPYLPETLDAQLDDAARSYLASPGAVEVIRARGKVTIVVPKFFEWYADEFKASGGPLSFIRSFGPQEAAEAIAGGKVKLEFADYDWSLNAAK